MRIKGFINFTYTYYKILSFSNFITITQTSQVEDSETIPEISENKKLSEFCECIT